MKGFRLDVKHGICIEADLDNPIIGVLNSIAFRYKNLTMSNLKEDRKAIGFYFKDADVLKCKAEMNKFLSSIRLDYKIYDEPYEKQVTIRTTKK